MFDHVMRGYLEFSPKNGGWQSMMMKDFCTKRYTGIGVAVPPRSMRLFTLPEDQ
jgi:hypothetical protein